LGTLVPGHVSIIVAGFLIKIGVFNVWFTCILAIAAAVFGDYIGYTLGKKYGLSLIDRVKPYFFITDEHIAKVQNLISKHTGKAMILSKFSPVTRSLMPFVVGANHTDEKRFWRYNIIGSCLWALGSIFLGYIFGAGYEFANIFTGRFVLIIAGASILILWGYRFINIRFHIFKKYELIILFLNISSLYVLALSLRDAVLSGPSLNNFDISANIFMNEHVTPFIENIASWISDGGAAFMAIVGIITTAFLIRQSKWRSLSILALSMGSTAMLMTFLKEFFNRARPEDALVIVNSASFPSAHAAMAAAFFLVFMYILVPKIHSWIKRELFIVVCVVSTIAIGLSRIVLNVHWSSDVIAGWSLGIVCTSASILFVKYVGGIIHKQIIE